MHFISQQLLATEVLALRFLGLLGPGRCLGIQ